MSILIQTCKDIDIISKHKDLHTDTIHHYDAKYKDYIEGIKDSTLSTRLMEKNKNKNNKNPIELEELIKEEELRRIELAAKLSFKIAHSTKIIDYLINEIEKKQEQYEALQMIYGD